MAISEQNIYTNSVHIEVHQEHTYMDNYVGKGPFKYYVSMFLAFFQPTQPPCKGT